MQSIFVCFIINVLYNNSLPHWGANNGANIRKKIKTANIGSMFPVYDLRKRKLLTFKGAFHTKRL